MDEKPDLAPDDANDVDSLEGADTVVEQPAGPSESDGANSLEGGAAPAGGAPAPKPPHKHRPGRLFGRFNIYLIVFVLLLIVAIAVVVFAVTRSKSSNQQLSSQTLSQSTLNQLANSDVTVGDVKQVLNVQSNAVFAGTVLVRGDLQVAGKLQVGSNLSLTGINVSGTSAFGQVQISNDLNVAGNESLQGQLTIQKSLTVNGTGTFNGALSAPQLTVTNLQLNGDLTLTHHLVPGGPNPARSYGNALGSGGSASVSGSDTSGSVTINTGGSPAAGCFMTLTFTQAFNATPHVLVTPVGSAAGGLQYYVNRSTSNFSICTNNAAPASSSFGFDYWVVD